MPIIDTPERTDGQGARGSRIEPPESGLPGTTDPSEKPTSPQKDPADWSTGGERMTASQASYLKTLCEEAGEEFDPSLTKAEASLRINELQAVTGRGQGPDTSLAH